MKKVEKLYWRKLDDQAKIYSLSYNKKDTSVFRLSILLKDKINPLNLQKAVEEVIEKYKVFKVKMRNGMFWNYLEENDLMPIISEEKEYPFQKLNTAENNNYLFKVTYFDKKINIDFFHILTDGNNGATFFKEIIYKYIELTYPDSVTYTHLNCVENLTDSENAYIKNYKKQNIKTEKILKGYKIKGEELEDGIVGINHFITNFDEIRKNAKYNECSLSVYIVSLFAYSIYIANYKTNEGKRPINICIPINLKKYFSSETMSNFVSYMVVSLNLKHNKEYTFIDILNIVKKEFDKKLKFEKIVETMSANGKLIHNPIIRIVPLILKRMLVILGSLNVKRQFTTTFSNIGKIEFDEQYTKYIENFFFILAPDWAEKIRCGVCSYEEKLIISFGTNLNRSSIEIKFKELLERENITFEIEGNYV